VKAEAKNAEPSGSEQQEEKKRGSGHCRPRVPLLPLHMPGRYYTGHVLAVSGWSYMKLSRRIKAGKFPAPQKDGELNYWSTAVVREALGL
jgi:hypothetical protein